ncbi:MAG: alpha/beta fold hydrolase [Sandaracinaceae bacterium]
MLIDTRLGRLFVEVRGEGPPLVLWHSLLCEGGMWRFQVPALAERFRVINIDAPGHGRSAPIRRGFSLEECAHAATEVMDALDVESAHWAGLSWGGMTGMRVALAYPTRLRSMALLDTSAHRESRRKLPSYHAMAFLARRIGAIGPLLDRIEPMFFASVTRESRREVIEPFRDHLSRMDTESLGTSVDAVIFDRVDIRDRLRAIRTPTLVIVGASDVATPPIRSREIADRIPGARFELVPGAGHLSALDRPERVTELLCDFFDGVEADAGTRSAERAS